MNSVDIGVEGLEEPPWREKAVSFITRALIKTGRDNWDLSVLFCDSAFIRDLNKRYRGRDESTDVLSFALGEDYEDGGGSRRCLPGDIVISLPDMEENARAFSIGPDEELRRLLIHGILHLEGMDHAANEPGEPMLQKQETLLAELAEYHIMDDHNTDHSINED